MTRLDDKYEQAEDAVDFRPYETAQRLVLYHTVVEALVPGHGITDDDPERAVVEALERVEQLGLARYGSEPIDDELPNLEERARELAEEVRSE